MRKTPDPVFIPILMAFMSVVTFEVNATVAIQDDKAPPESPKSPESPANPESPVPAARGDNASVLEELGETLKAAVLSGTLSEEEAIEIYDRMSRNLTTENAKKTAIADKGYDGPYAAKLDIMMLIAPRPGQMTTLFQPEFLPRDLHLLRREIDLDRDQMVIIEILLRDYLKAFELASKPLREGLRHFRRLSADRFVAEAIERVQIEDTNVAIANIMNVLHIAALASAASESDKKDTISVATPDRDVKAEQKRADRKAWERRMVVVTATMEDRLSVLRERVQARISQMERAGSMVTIDGLVRMAHELRGERRQLRAQFTELLGLIVLIEQTDAAQARFNTALARVRIEHDLSRGRMGGEFMNLWVALIETTIEYKSQYGRGTGLDEVRAMLNVRATAIAAILDDRTEATIDREVRGLDYLATRDRISAGIGDPASGGRIDPTRLASALRPFVEALRRELAASVAVRDELMALLDESSDRIDATYPETNISTAYREAALRRGFRTEMRQRFSEQALQAALRLDDLDVDSRSAIVAIESEVAATLRTLRADAIAKRIRRDPKRALQRIEAQLEGRSSSREKFDLEELLGFNHKAYTALDERIEDQLRAILTPEQFATLPPRPRAITIGKD